MKVTIRETGKIEEVDSDYESLIGAYYGFSEEQFHWDDDADMFFTSQANYDWWTEIIEKDKKLNDRIAALEEEHGREAVLNVVQNAPVNELEDHADAINWALNEAFGEEEGK